MFQEGRTALLVACWRGFLPIVVMLIKSGANTNAQDQVYYNVIQR
jgi:ankyrin repeat protein